MPALLNGEARMSVVLIVLCALNAVVAFCKASDVKNAALASSSIVTGIIWAVVAVAVALLFA